MSLILFYLFLGLMVVILTELTPYRMHMDGGYRVHTTKGTLSLYLHVDVFLFAYCSPRLEHTISMYDRKTRSFTCLLPMHNLIGELITVIICI